MQRAAEWVIGGHGCELYAPELPRFENSRNVEMRCQGGFDCQLFLSDNL
jgi:hypothetical protein